MKILSFTFCFLISLYLYVCFAHGSSMNRIEEILDQHAKNTNNVFDSTSCFLIEGYVKFTRSEGAPEYPFKLYQAYPYFYRMTYFIQNDSIITGQNGRFSWGKSREKIDTISYMEYYDSLFCEKLIDLINNKSLSFSYLGISTFANKTCYKIRLTSTLNNRIKDYYFDTLSYNQIGIDVVYDSSKYQSIYRNFQSVNGFIFPFEEIQVVYPEYDYIIQVTNRIEFDVECSNTIFEP